MKCKQTKEQVQEEQSNMRIKVNDLAKAKESESDGAMIGCDLAPILGRCLNGEVMSLNCADAAGAF